MDKIKLKTIFSPTACKTDTIKITKKFLPYLATLKKQREKRRKLKKNRLN